MAGRFLGDGERGASTVIYLLVTVVCTFVFCYFFIYILIFNR